jgi:hypothetical protein
MCQISLYFRGCVLPVEQQASSDLLYKAKAPIYEEGIMLMTT